MLFVWRMAMCSVNSLAALYSIRQKFEICPIGDALWSLQISLINYPLENPLKRLILNFFCVYSVFKSLKFSHISVLKSHLHQCPTNSCSMKRHPCVVSTSRRAASWFPSWYQRPILFTQRFHFQTNWSFYFFLPHNNSLAYLIYAVQL